MRLIIHITLEIPDDNSSVFSDVLALKWLLDSTLNLRSTSARQNPQRVSPCDIPEVPGGGFHQAKYHDDALELATKLVDLYCAVLLSGDANVMAC